MRRTRTRRTRRTRGGEKEEKKEGKKTPTAVKWRKESHPSERRSKTKERWMNTNPTESNVNTFWETKK